MTSDKNAVIQTTIAIDRVTQASFDNFHAGDNQEAVTLLRELLDNPPAVASCYLWGARGTGKSHLLYAACKAVSFSTYVPIMDLSLPFDCLVGLETSRLVCVDDIQAIAHQMDWEKQLLALVENIAAQGNLLVLTGNCPPDQLDFKLKDLVNRLKGRQVIKLSPATDQTKVNILVERAAARGLVIEESVANYILRHYSREMHAVIRILDRILHASLENRRRITIPFLREMDEFQH